MTGEFVKAVVKIDGKDMPCILPASHDTMKYLESLQTGELLAGKFYEKETPASIKQHGLYWKCIEVLKDNKKCKTKEEELNWNTKAKCAENIKIICRFVKSWFHYMNKRTGESTLQIITKSEGFETPEKERREFFKDAFPAIASELGITEDELVAEAKARMVGRTA